jgi:hypothetical protein
MKKKILLTLSILLFPLSVYAVPVMWDGNFSTQILQPLQSYWNANVRASYFTATSTTATNRFDGKMTLGLGSNPALIADSQLYVKQNNSYASILGGGGSAYAGMYIRSKDESSSFGGDATFVLSPEEGIQMAAKNSQMVIGSNIYILPNNNLGVGTTTPARKLSVTGDIHATGAYYASNNSAGISGQVLSSTGSGTQWITSLINLDLDAVLVNGNSAEDKTIKMLDTEYGFISELDAFGLISYEPTLQQWTGIDYEKLFFYAQGNNAVLKSDNLTGNTEHLLPNKSGTIAHTNDIPLHLVVESGGLRTATTTDYIKANHFIATSTSATSTLPNLFVTNFRLGGGLYDSANSIGTAGMVLQATGTSTRWVATSTLGITGGASTFLNLTDTISSYNVNRILYTSGSAVVDSSSFTFNGTTLTAPVLSVTTSTATSSFAGGLTVGSTNLVVDRVTGNVGIGKNPAPTGKLDVGGALSLRVQGNAFDAGVYAALVIGQGDSGGLYAIGRGNTANKPFTGLSGYDWGSGVGHDAGRYLYFGGGGWDVPDATGIAFYTAAAYNETKDQGVARMVISNTGNIGIGTTSPTQKLVVEGNVLADSYLEYSDVFVGDALTAIRNIKAEPNTRVGDWAKVDHDSLPSGVKYQKEVEILIKEEGERGELVKENVITETFVGRDLGKSVQLVTAGVKQLITQVDDIWTFLTQLFVKQNQLEQKVQELEARILLLEKTLNESRGL